MKRFCLLLGLLIVAGHAHAGRAVYQGPLVNETALTQNTIYPLDVNSYGIDTLSFLENHSSATIAAPTFTDGGPSTGTITVSTTGLTTLNGVKGSDTVNVVTNSALAAKQASQTLNVSTTTGLANATITINGNVIANPRNWALSTSSTTEAANIAAAINAFLPDVSATSSGSTVTITADVFGTAGNAFTLSASTPTALVRGGATFTGGQNAATINLNGNLLVANVDWTVADVASNTAVNIKNALGAITGFSASTTTASTTTVTCTTIGTFCNAYTLVSSTQAALAVGGATFSGGQAPAYVMINGIKLTESTDWTAVATASGTAKAISDAIMANSSLSAIIGSTWSLVSVSSKGVVNATSTANASTANYSLVAYPANVLVTSGAQMTGGSVASYALNGTVITKTAHGLTTGLPVLYTTGTVAITGLSNGTTYYAIRVDANSFKLSATSTGAVAGTAITLASLSASGPHTYTLTPLAFTGTASFKWQAADLLQSETCANASNWVDLSVSSVTFGTPYTAASTAWDFSQFNYQCIRLNVVAQTTGGLKLIVRANGKNIYLANP